MKISVDVDCTPEEARRFMGLPDMSSVHEAYLSKLRAMVEDGVKGEAVEGVLKSWAPLGEAGMSFWQRLIEQMSSPKAP